MTAISGQNLVGSWLNSGPLGSLEKMLLATSAWDSTTCFLTWKDKATPQGRLLFQLAPLTRRTEGTGSGLWPTPDIRGFTNEGSMMMLKEKAENREEWAGMAYRGGRKEKFWPTPTTRDHKGGRKPETLQASGMGATNSLNDALTCQGQHGSLNPTWVEWLMGFPEGWTDLKPSEMPSSRKSPK